MLNAFLLVVLLALALSRSSHFLTVPSTNHSQISSANPTTTLSDRPRPFPTTTTITSQAGHTVYTLSFAGTTRSWHEYDDDDGAAQPWKHQCAMTTPRGQGASLNGTSTSFCMPFDLTFISQSSRHLVQHRHASDVRP